MMIFFYFCQKFAVICTKFLKSHLHWSSVFQDSSEHIKGIKLRVKEIWVLQSSVKFLLGPLALSGTPWYAMHWCSLCCSPCLVQAPPDSLRMAQHLGSGCAQCFRAELPWWEHSRPSSWEPAHTPWRLAPLPASTPRSYTEEAERERQNEEGLLVTEFKAKHYSEVSLSVPKGLLFVYIPPYLRDYSDQGNWEISL